MATYLEQNLLVKEQDYLQNLIQCKLQRKNRYLEHKTVVQLEVMAYSNQVEIQVRHLFSKILHQLNQQLMMQEGIRQQVYFKIQTPYKIQESLAGLYKDHKIQQ